MNLSKFTLTLFLSVIAFGCSNFFNRVTDNIETDSHLLGKNSSPDESYFVYSALLENENRGGVKLHVIIEDIVIDNGAVAGKITIPTEKVIQNIKLILPAEYKASFEDYKLKNKEALTFNDEKSLKLTESFKLQNKYVLTNLDNLESIYRDNPKNYWESFNRKYPKSGGYVSFSQVGFDAEKRHAFVSMNYYCGSLCGNGSYYLLEKENDKWIETKRANLWNS